MLLISELSFDSVAALLGQYGLSVELIADEQTINGSYWGDPEAGLMGDRVLVRSDTPVHSVLHETCHIVCMSPQRRRRLEGNAGGDDLEECAVCYLRIVLADELPEAGGDQQMRDMEDWGYSFRLGSATRWFEEDAEDAQLWLRAEGLLDADDRPIFRLR